MIEMRKGLIAAPLTGYRDDGTINLDVIPPYAEMLQANGVAGVFVNGTTGEGFSLTLSERRALAERWVQAAPNGFRVIIHVGHTCQAESRALVVHAADIGAAAVGEIGPIFFRPASVEALVDYCAETAAAAPNLPYYYYHMPSMNQVLFPMTANTFTHYWPGRSTSHRRHVSKRSNVILVFGDQWRQRRNDEHRRCYC